MYLSISSPFHPRPPAAPRSKGLAAARRLMVGALTLSSLAMSACDSPANARQHLLALMRSELVRSPEAHTPLLRSLAALTCSGADQLALELGKASEHSDHQLAMRRGGVRPAVLQGTR
jgi:hypothetical protein